MGADGTPSVLTSLDLHETNDVQLIPEPYPDYPLPRDDFRVPPIEDVEDSFRHRRNMATRKAVFAAMVDLHLSVSRLDRFRNCGSCCYVRWSPSLARASLVGNYCHDRLCPACGESRSRVVQRNLHGFVGKRPTRFVTLTLRHNPLLSLTEMLDRLYRGFKSLRNSPFWKGCTKGGAAFLEVKLSKEGHWHPHLHVICEGSFVDQKELSHQWYLITGDSSIVDVRRVSEGGQELRYVCKYVGKPLDASVYQNREALCKFILAIRGRRMCFTFGSWRGLRLEEPGEDPRDWVTVGRLVDLIRDARSGDPHALKLLNLVSPEWERKKPKSGSPEG